MKYELSNSVCNWLSSLQNIEARRCADRCHQVNASLQRLAQCQAGATSFLMDPRAKTPQNIGTIRLGAMWTTGRPDDPRHAKPGRFGRSSQSSAVPMVLLSSAASICRVNSLGIGFSKLEPIVPEYDIDRSMHRSIISDDKWIDFSLYPTNIGTFHPERGSAAIGARL